MMILEESWFMSSQTSRHSGRVSSLRGVQTFAAVIAGKRILERAGVVMATGFETRSEKFKVNTGRERFGLILMITRIAGKWSRQSVRSRGGAFPSGSSTLRREPLAARQRDRRWRGNASSKTRPPTCRRVGRLRGFW